MMLIRPYFQSDRENCINLYYAAREAKQIPPQYMAEFKDNIDADDVLTLVGIVEGKIVACGSVNYYGESRVAQLTYGIVHPEQQRKGIGSKMLIARISLLKAASTSECYVWLSATVHSRQFFVKVVGFGEDSHELDEYGNQFHNLYLPLSPRLLEMSQQHMKNSDVDFEANIEVPIRLPVTQA